MVYYMYIAQQTQLYCTLYLLQYIDKMYEEDLNEHEDEVFERLKKAKKKAEQVVSVD